MNGIGCYGAIPLAILISIGYNLQWIQNNHYGIYNDNKIMKYKNPRGNRKQYELLYYDKTCGCVTESGNYRDPRTKKVENSISKLLYMMKRYT